MQLSSVLRACAQHAQRLYRHVYLACKEESSGRGHYQALFTLLAVLTVELATEEVVVDLIRLVLALQVNGASVITAMTVQIMLSRSFPADWSSLLCSVIGCSGAGVVQSGVSVGL